MNSPEGSKTGTVQTHQTDALYKCIVKNNIQMHAFMARSIMMMHIGNQIRCWQVFDVDKGFDHFGH